MLSLFTIVHIGFVSDYGFSVWPVARGRSVLCWNDATPPNPRMEAGFHFGAHIFAFDPRSRPGVHSLSVPLYVWALVLWALFIWLVRRSEEPVPQTSCEHCGYDREGLARGSICPECGKRPHDATAKAPDAGPS